MIEKKPLWRRIARHTPVHPVVRFFRDGEWDRRRAYWLWMKDGRPVPAPPRVKQMIVRRVAKGHRCNVLVETGTYVGDMLAANRHHFDRLISIELDEDLWRQARRVVEDAENVTLLHGDSAALLPGIVAELREPTLFWLDAHYAGEDTARGAVDTPIETELRTILAAPANGHVVLIDDARFFGTGDYPQIDAIKALIAPRELVVEHDMLRFRV